MAWIAAKLVSSNRETRYASEASCRTITAKDWKRRSDYVPKSWISADHRATRLKVLCDFTNEALEREFADEKLGGLLVATDFTDGDLFQGRNDGASS